MTAAPPSHDAASEDSLTGALKVAYRKFLQDTDDMLPAQVVSYDRVTNRAVVRPFIRVLSTQGGLISRQSVAGIPVFQMGAGGFVLSFPMQPGDRGWIKASDRDISLFLQAYAEAGPNSRRFHSFSDGMFFPDVMNDYTLASEDQGNVVLQNKSGSVKISLGADKIKITAPLVEIAAADVTIAGKLTVQGLIESGTDVKAGAVTLKTLTVTGVVAGDETSGVPVQ